MMPYRILCNGVKREYVRTCPDQASRLFCSVPLHKIRYGIKTIAAFANAEGGVILLGIDDKSGNIVGITESPNRVKDSTMDLIRRKVVPEPHIRFEDCDIDGKQVVAVFVEKGSSPPYGINPEKPEFYVRRGATTFPARQEEIRVLAQSNNKKSEINHE